MNTAPFKSIYSGMLGNWQFTVETHDHVTVYKAKLWPVDKAYDEHDLIVLYDSDILELAQHIVIELLKKAHLDPTMKIIWLS